MIPMGRDLLALLRQGITRRELAKNDPAAIAIVTERGPRARRDKVLANRLWEPTLARCREEIAQEYLGE